MTSEDRDPPSAVETIAGLLAAAALFLGRARARLSPVPARTRGALARARRDRDEPPAPAAGEHRDRRDRRLLRRRGLAAGDHAPSALLIRGNARCAGRTSGPSLVQHQSERARRRWSEQWLRAGAARRVSREPGRRSARLARAVRERRLASARDPSGARAAARAAPAQRGRGRSAWRPSRHRNRNRHRHRRSQPRSPCSRLRRQPTPTRSCSGHRGGDGARQGTPHARPPRRAARPARVGAGRRPVARAASARAPADARAAGPHPGVVLRVHVPGETLADVLPKLVETYCGTIAYELEHLSDHEQRVWLRRAIESGRVPPAARRPTSSDRSSAASARWRGWSGSCASGSSGRSSSRSKGST